MPLVLQVRLEPLISSVNDRFIVFQFPNELFAHTFQELIVDSVRANELEHDVPVESVLDDFNNIFCLRLGELDGRQSSENNAELSELGNLLHLKRDFE